MKHIFDAHDLRSSHVTIFGKGPSFCRLSVRPGKIYALNQAAIWLMDEGIIPDLIVCNDYEPIEEISSWCIKNNITTNLACPSYPHRNKNVAEKFNMETPLKVYHYDLWTAQEKEFFWPRFWFVETSYNSALLIAEMLGVKTIDTSGVDHGEYDSQFMLENRFAFSGTRFWRTGTGGKRVERCGFESQA